jgi:hypothetical protein
MTNIAQFELEKSQSRSSKIGEAITIGISFVAFAGLMLAVGVRDDKDNASVEALNQLRKNTPVDQFAPTTLVPLTNGLEGEEYLPVAYVHIDGAGNCAVAFKPLKPRGREEPYVAHISCGD